MADGPRNLPSKKDVVLALLQGPSVFVHLDPRKKGVVVPANFRKQPQLVLQIGLNMAVQIPDLRVDENGVSCTLSFNRSPFWCVLPWTAIYALVSEDGPGMVWPDDVPPEVAAQMQAAVAKQQPKRPRPRLAAVGPRPASEPPDEAAPASPEPEEEPASTGGGAQVVPLRPVAKKDPEPEPPPPEADEPEDTPRPPAPRGAPGKKPRRELPPYLRVIK
ncbi:MAG: ClpXP protease specificity-enhancing factor SspB [Polyangiaceae bacterium]